MHQANRNLTERVAKVLDVPVDCFFSNIRQYGNTSSASLLIAASEWSKEATLAERDFFCFAAFGAGFHWGAILLQKCNLKHHHMVL
jgi:3-oxoacyl-[acyl-carrier-protein] synthase-3